MSKDSSEMQKINENLEVREQNEPMGIAKALNGYNFNNLLVTVSRFKTLDEFLGSIEGPDLSLPSVAEREQAPLPAAQLDPLQREEMINAHMVRQRAFMNRYRQQRDEERQEIEQAQMAQPQPRMPVL